MLELSKDYDGLYVRLQSYPYDPGLLIDSHTVYLNILVTDTLISNHNFYTCYSRILGCFAV